MSVDPAGLAAIIRRSRWPALGLALLVVVLDQGCKQLAVDHLASPAHPLLVPASGDATVHELLAERGVAVDVSAAAIARRMVWRYRVHGPLSAGLRLDEREVPRQIILATGTGYPAPRRIRLLAEDRARTMGEVIADQSRMAPSGVAFALQAGVLAAESPVVEADERPEEGEVIALLDRQIDVIPGFMKLVYAENRGAAWGFMRDAGETFRLAFFGGVGILAACAMIWAIWTGWMGSIAGTLALGAVLGGAVGNLIDRVRYQVVVDFVLNYVGDARWPVYNVADIAISVGVGLIVLEMFLLRRQQRLQPADG